MESQRLRAALTVFVAVMVGPFALFPAKGEESYPSRAIKFVVPFPAGGLPDTVARVVGRRMQERLGQPTVVENRPGANGGIAAAALANSLPDGHTLMVTDGAILSINPAIYAKLPYNPQDIMPVALLARAPLFLAVHTKVPAGTMEQFIEYVRARSGELSYGTPGIGSVHHLSMEAIKAGLELKMTHVPFKGTVEAVSALLGGHVEAIFAAYPALSGAVGGRVKLLATNGAKRSAQAPDLPAAAEFIRDFDFTPIVGIYGRVGTPSALVAKIAAEAVAIVKEPDAIRQLAVVGVEPAGGGADDFGRALKAESERVAKVVQSAGLKLQ
jgi:tripartite-type tricarboxylate transporter receptor subunit TctC